MLGTKDAKFVVVPPYRRFDDTGHVAGGSSAELRAVDTCDGYPA